MKHWKRLFRRAILRRTKRLVHWAEIADRRTPGFVLRRRMAPVGCSVSASISIFTLSMSRRDCDTRITATQDRGYLRQMPWISS
jgi:hypothetical protein